MKVYIAQLNPTVGALAANAELIRRAYAEGVAAGADVVLTTELAVTGYPPRDLLDRITAAESAAAAKGSRDTVHSAGPAAGQPQALFLHTPDGFGTSELAQNVFKIIAPPKDKKHGLAATARNWATATKLLSLCEEKK